MVREEPKRVKIEDKRGLHVVYKGEIIEDLGWDKNTKVFYAIGSKPRKWFTRDFSKSYFLFNKWKDKVENYTILLSIEKSRIFQPESTFCPINSIYEELYVVERKNS